MLFRGTMPRWHFLPYNRRCSWEPLHRMSAMIQLPRRVGRYVLLASLAAVLSVPAGAAAATGDLDPSFGSGGRVTTPGPGDAAASANGISRQQDGKLVVAGCASDPSGTGRFMFARYNSDGSLDPSFGSGGTVLISLGVSTSACVEDLVLQPDRKIVAVGRSSNSGGGSRFAVVRLNADGTPDATFGSNGTVIVSPGIGTSEATSVGLQPDGQIVVAGGASFDPDPSDSDGRAVEGFAVVRLNGGDGGPDASFGSGGTSTVAFTSRPEEGGANAPDLLVEPSGKIVAGGVAINDWPDDSTGTRTRFALARLNSNGSLDGSFGGDGKVVDPIRSTDGFAHGRSLARQSDGKIVMAGDYYSVLGDGTYGPRRWLIARYANDGGLDSSFGSAGSTVVPVGGPTASSETAPGELEVQPDDKIVAAGTADDSTSGPCVIRFAAARLTAGGSLDSSFSSDGTVEGPPFGGSDPWCRAHGRALALDAGGLVVAGPVDTQIGLARYVDEAPDADRDGVPDATDQCPNVAGPAPAGCPKPSYVALGDSVAAGEGIGYGWEWSTTPGRDPHWVRAHSSEDWDTQYQPTACHQTAEAHPRLIASALGADSVHLACTGAAARNGVLTSQFKKGTEVTSAQLGVAGGSDPGSRRYNSADPDVVSLSLGADDIEFADELADCYLGRTQFTYTRCDTDQARDDLKKKLLEQRAGLRDVLTEVRDRGHAQGKTPLVALTQYFDPFPASYPKAKKCIDINPPGLGGSLSGDEVNYLRDGLEQLNTGLTQIAREFGNVVVVPPPADFADHRFCSEEPGGPWVFGPSLRLSRFPFEKGNQAPFHPTAAGQESISKGVTAALSAPHAVGPGTDVTTRFQSGVRVTFQRVTGEGTVLAFAAPSTGACVNSTFTPAGKAMEIASSAEKEGAIRVSLPSTEARTLYHCTDGRWQAVADSKFEGGAVTGTVDSLSPFVLGTPTATVTASFAANGQGPAPAGVHFDASASNVEGGAVDSYAWDFGDGATGAGSTPTHTYASSGTYEVTLTVVSAEGATDETTQPVTVTNPAPVARISAPASAEAGAVAHFDAGASTDPNDSISKVVWDFGDASEASSGSTASHTYQQPGDYTVSATVFDEEDLTSATTASIRILPAAGTPTPPSTGSGLSLLTPPPLALSPLTRDLAPPVITSVRLAPRRFPTSKRSRRRGTVLSYRLSEAAKVRLEFKRAIPCRGRAARRKSCRRYVTAGSLRRSSPAGRTRFAFRGRIGTRTLRVGQYRLVLSAVDKAGNRSRVRTVPFVVIRR